MGEKNKVKFSRYIANEWSEPNPGQSRLLCNQTCAPEFCVIQDYITPRKREYVIEFPSLIHYKRGDMITMHFTAPREIIAHNNKGDVEAIYEMLAGLKQQESIESLEVGVMFCGNNGEFVSTYPAKTTSDRNHTSMDFNLKVEPDSDLSFCEVRYTLFWEPYKLSRKDDGCGCDENQDELSSDWVFDVKLYYHSATVDEEEIKETNSLVEVGLKTLEDCAVEKDNTILTFDKYVKQKEVMLSTDQEKFFSDIKENQAILAMTQQALEESIAENNKIIAESEADITTKEGELGTVDPKSLEANKLRNEIIEARQKIDEIKSALDSDEVKLLKLAKAREMNNELASTVKAEERIGYFELQSKELCENFLKSLEINVDDVKISNQRKLKEMLAELNRIEMMLDKDNCTKYDALSSTDQTIICDLHDKILNGTEVRDIKEKLKNLDLDQLSQLSQKISDIENEYEQLLCELRINGNSIYEFPRITVLSFILQGGSGA